MDTQFELHAMLAKDTIELMDLPLSKVLLMNDSQFPWLILVPKVNDVKEIYQLNWDEQIQLLNESSLVSELMMQLFSADKMNLGALGNICPQLHIHHIARFKDDIAWPGPVWGAQPSIKYSDSELSGIKEKLLSALSAISNAENRSA